ncbi:hypothetical protein MLPF_0201 [Mycobacterium lepromatosis]|nr:hypothetical protein MLPF_0201 [Mycobacterium lepromatosis]
MVKHKEVRDAEKSSSQHVLHQNREENFIPHIFLSDSGADGIHGGCSCLNTIVVNRKIAHERPVIHGTRMHIADVLSLLTEGNPK